MNNKKLLIITGVASLFILCLATLWHFIYGWFSITPMALIAPVNESPWEHVKMFFVPAILVYLVEYLIIGKHYRNFVFSKGVVLLFMPIFMFIMFYGYRDILNIPEKLIYDIIVTAISIITGSFLSYLISVSYKNYSKYHQFTAIVVSVLLISYGTLTYVQPKTPLFYDRNFDGYGIPEEGFDHDHDDDHDNEMNHNNDD